MKKILSLIFAAMSLTAFSSAGKEASMSVTATVLQCAEVVSNGDMSFGTVMAGTNENKAKSSFTFRYDPDANIDVYYNTGKIIRGNNGDLALKNKDGETLNVKLTFDESLPHTATDGTSRNQHEVIVNGTLDVPKTASLGEYKGTIVARINYK